MESKEKPDKIPVAILIGHGSRAKPILFASAKPTSHFSISIVVSHRKPEENQEDVPGITEAKKLRTPTAYWNLVQMAANREIDKDQYRPEFEENLAAFLNQSSYKPEFIFMTGWMLILSDHFLKHFKVGNRYQVLNIHPFWLPDLAENQDEITLPSGQKAPVLRGPGDEVIEKTLELGLSHTGVTVYWVQPDNYDIGQVILRQWLEIAKNETPKTLREKLNQVEDQLGPAALEKVALEILRTKTSP